MASRLARLATASPTPPPKRFFLLYIPHGVAPEHFNPRVQESNYRDFALDQTNVSILGPLEPYKQYVNVYEGFQYVGAADTHEGIVNCLSGSTAIDTTTPRTTVEHVIGKGLGVRPLILGACSHQPYGLDNHGMLFWDGTPIEPEKDPAKAADDLFGTDTPEPEIDVDAELRVQLLGLTAGEIQTLQSELGGLTREQNKLAAHLQAVQVLQEGAGSSGNSNCTARPTLPTVEMVRAASAGQVIDVTGGNDYFYQEQNFSLLMQAQMELVTQALICNAAQVSALMPMYATCDFDFGFLGGVVEAADNRAHHNGLSHTMGQAADGAQWDSPVTVDNFRPESRIAFATAQRWFIQELVDRVVSVLATTDDPSAPGTTVLDNTIIYCMSEVGDGQAHTRTSELTFPQVPTSLPLITIGGGGGALDTGQVIRFNIGAQGEAAGVNRPATDLYLSLAQAMGVSGATFPGTTGPVTEMLL
jgi:hypothetical protein